ncbi:bifunctional DNA primase/polymerase [Streptomyces anulatus]|uniref:bifunctional DNA primase/polymerase n=1 Tax=Streptomyces anulatus TaxID=1892 RepID=UPI0038692015
MRNIDSWWTTSPDAGVGVACEPVNLIVIDIDAHSAPARPKPSPPGNPDPRLGRP